MLSHHFNVHAFICYITLSLFLFFNIIFIIFCYIKSFSFLLFLLRLNILNILYIFGCSNTLFSRSHGNNMYLNMQMCGFSSTEPIKTAGNKCKNWKWFSKEYICGGSVLECLFSFVPYFWTVICLQNKMF